MLFFIKVNVVNIFDIVSGNFVTMTEIVKIVNCNSLNHAAAKMLGLEIIFLMLSCS